MVFEAGDAEEALRMSENETYKFDLVVTDVAMPGLNAFSGARRSREASFKARCARLAGAVFRVVRCFDDADEETMRPFIVDLRSFRGPHLSSQS